MTSHDMLIAEALAKLRAQWYRNKDMYMHGMTTDHTVVDNDHNPVAVIRIDKNGPRVLHTRKKSPVYVDPDIEDMPSARSTRAINSKEGKQTEVNEAAIRRNRERHRELAEAHAHDRLEEAQFALTHSKRNVRLALGFAVTGGAVTFGVPALDMVVGVTGFFIAIFIMGVLALAAGISGLIVVNGDHVVYKDEKKIREAQHELRDVLTRPIEHYKTDKPRE